MPETRGQPQPERADALTIAHESRAQRAMRTLLPGGIGLTRPAADVVASDPRYESFVRWVSPVQWMAAANRESLSLAQIVDAILRDGPDPRLLRNIPGLTSETWRDRVEECYDRLLADLSDDEADEARWRAQREAADQYPDIITGTKRTGADTAFHEAHPDLPRHRPDRLSQTPEGRRARYIRNKARDEGISIAEAEQRHPARPAKDRAS